MPKGAGPLARVIAAMTMAEERRVLSLDEIKNELTTLHGKAGALMAEAHHLRPSVKLLLARTPVATLEERLDEYFRVIVSLDADLIRHANAPSDINTALRNSAQFSSYAAVRDSVRGLLTDAADAVAAIRTRLDFIGSLVVSIIALVVAIIAVLVDVAG